MVHPRQLLTDICWEYRRTSSPETSQLNWNADFCDESNIFDLTKECVWREIDTVLQENIPNYTRKHSQIKEFLVFAIATDVEVPLPGGGARKDVFGPLEALVRKEMNVNSRQDKVLNVERHGNCSIFFFFRH